MGFMADVSQKGFLSFISEKDNELYSLKYKCVGEVLSLKSFPQG